MPKQKELVVWAKNRPGNLAKVGNTLRENGINIVALMATGLPEMPRPRGRQRLCSPDDLSLVVRAAHSAMGQRG